MSSVFHYTDSAGLLGILSSKSLFATDYRYLNDVSEGSLIRDLILPILEDEIAEIIPKLRDRGLIKGFYETHGVRGNRLQAEGFYTSLVDSLDATTPPFVLSFCRHTEEKAKHGLLSQWRGYAGSAGFAIEFDEPELGELIRVEKDTFAYVWMKSDYVRYKGYDDLFDPKVYRGVSRELIRRMFEPRDVSDITGRMGPKEMDKVMVDFAKTAPFLKHEGFREEEEYRIIAGRVDQDKIGADSKRRVKKIQFRSKEGLIVPYIKLFEESPRDLPITSIIVGPHPFQDKQEAAVRMALKSSPFSNAVVRLSAIPFRR